MATLATFAVIPAKAGISCRKSAGNAVPILPEIPALAGMTQDTVSRLASSRVRVNPYLENANV